MLSLSIGLRWVFVDKTDRKCLTQFVFTVSQASSFFSLIQYLHFPHMPRTSTTSSFFLAEANAYVAPNCNSGFTVRLCPGALLRLVIACLKQKNKKIPTWTATQTLQDNPLHYTQTHYTVNDRTVFPHLPASSFSQVLLHILQENTRCKHIFVSIRVCCKWSKKHTPL